MTYASYSHKTVSRYVTHTHSDTSLALEYACAYSGRGKNTQATPSLLSICALMQAALSLLATYCVSMWLFNEWIGQPPVNE